jgi:hypothetical protein
VPHEAIFPAASQKGANTPEDGKEGGDYDFLSYFFVF